jgi:hypothetical protein
VAEIEGNNTSKDELGDAFDALLADIGEEEEEQHLEQCSNSYFTSSYFTSVESLLTESLVAPSIIVPYAKTLVNDLNNQALMHQLTNRLPFKLIEEVTDNFTTKGPTSRYNFHCFYGIVINTGASKYSIAGYGQF